MAIVINLGLVLAKQKMSLNALSEKVGIALSYLSIFKLEGPKPSVFNPRNPLS